jgi:hypothetical protein
MKIKFLFLAVSFILTALFNNITAQTVLSDKVVSYHYFLDDQELLQEVLNQSKVAKSKKCSVVVTDSIFKKRSDVKAKTVKETFDLSYNSQGLPTKLEYNFTSNKVGFTAEVPFVYSGFSTFIVATTQLSGAIPIPFNMIYLYNSSKDGKYNARSSWFNADDTSSAPNSRQWSVKNNQGIDSINSYVAEGLSYKTILSSNIRTAGQSVCKFTIDTDVEEMKMNDGSTVIYKFDSNGNIISRESGDKKEEGGSTWTYDANNRLTSRNNTYKGQEGSSYEHITIVRDAQGKPSQVYIVTNQQALRFDFTWK